MFSMVLNVHVSKKVPSKEKGGISTLVANELEIFCRFRKIFPFSAYVYISYIHVQLPLSKVES